MRGTRTRRNPHASGSRQNASNSARTEGANPQGRCHPMFSPHHRRDTGPTATHVRHDTAQQPLRYQFRCRGDAKAQDRPLARPGRRLLFESRSVESHGDIPTAHTRRIASYEPRFIREAASRRERPHGGERPATRSTPNRPGNNVQTVHRTTLLPAPTAADHVRRLPYTRHPTPTIGRSGRNANFPTAGTPPDPPAHEKSRPDFSGRLGERQRVASADVRCGHRSPLPSSRFTWNRFSRALLMPWHRVYRSRIVSPGWIRMRLRGLARASRTSISIGISPTQGI